MNDHQIFAIRRFWEAKESWEYHMDRRNKNAMRDAGWRMSAAARDCKILHALVDGRIPRATEAEALWQRRRRR